MMVKYFGTCIDRKEYHRIASREFGPPAESPNGEKVGKCVRERGIQYE
jgi:hypothetical protein